MRQPGPVRIRGEIPATALLVGLPLLIILLIWACWPRDYYTGTDSIRTRGFVEPVPAGQTLCVTGLNVPAGTGRVQFEVLTGGPSRPAMNLVLRTPAGATMATGQLPYLAGDGPQTKVAFPIPVRADRPSSVPASACVTADRLINFGGTLNIGGPPPTLDGQPIGPARLAVWFLPPAGAKRSLAAQLPTVFDRAALFRPSWVGAWTYYVLLGILLPLAFALALFLLIRAQTLSWPLLAAGVFAVAVAITVSWSLVTPPFQAPDEQDHFAYVQQLAETGKAPSQSAALPPWSSALTIALQSIRSLAANEQADGRPPWLPLDVRAWAAANRLDPSRKDGGGITTAATHGPIYYGVETVAYDLAGTSIWSQLTATRLMSGLISALAVVLVLLAAREVAPTRHLFAVGAALLVCLNPMFTFIGASVNNDVGVNAAAALFLFLIVRAIRRGLSLPLAAALGLTLGVTPIIKGTSYTLWVVAALALLALLARERTRTVLVGVVAATLALVLVQLAWSDVAADFGRTTFTTPGGGAPISASLWSTARLSLGYLWQIFLPPLPGMVDHYPLSSWPAYTIYVVRGWASFGWYDIIFPRIVYAVIMAGIVATGVAGVIFARRHRACVKENWVLILTLTATPVIVVAGVERAFATPGQRGIIAEMGRYLFPAIGALAILAVGSFRAWGDLWATRITTGVIVSAMILTYASQLLTLRGFYT
ncbi:MAG TPA: DUF2142 domain-containing protein [Solirubrobacteraceae bacterium]|jgi:hypothetical protein|nr:DUF2142 domain-containing protein [Solirubrobacteraceae bacterium]